MLVFELELPPPTRLEIQAERERLKGERKRLLRAGLISDVLHALVLFALYFSGILSGRGLVAAVLLGTLIAVVLATRTKATGIGWLPLILLGAGFGVGGMLIGYFAEDPLSGVAAGAATCSLIATGSLLGRRIMRVLSGLENLKPIGEDHPAHQEVLALCRQHPELDEYRQQARRMLRPSLTCGELKAMQEWAVGPSEAPLGRSGQSR